MILDPTKEGMPNQIGPLHNAMQLMGEMIANSEPDLIFLSTPHGIALTDDYGLYANQIAQGTAEWDNEYVDYKIQIPLDQDVTESCYQWLKKQGLPVTKITSFSSTMPIPLRWGEVVPLWFLKNIDTKYVIMTQPTKRHDQSHTMIPELLQLGRHLARFFSQDSHKITIIISGDLAHTHLSKGPYGYSKKAAIFDNFIEQWIRSAGKNPSLLLIKAAEVLDEALCCGFTGFVLLQGILETIPLEFMLNASGHPTYYGMAVATYQRGGDDV